MKLIFILSWITGVTLITIPILLSIKLKKKRRISAAQVRRKEKFETFFYDLVDSENEKKSNYKIIRILKLANYPLGMDIFGYRLAQIIMPIGTATLIGILHLLQNHLRGYEEPFPILLFSGLVLISVFIPYLVVRTIAYQRRMQLSAEIAKFSHRLIVGVNDRAPLYYSIKRASRTAKVLKPYLDQLLIEWLESPKAAIKNFGDAVAINEVVPLVNTLLATWNAPKEKIVGLFQQQIRQIDAMRDFMIKRQIEMSPMGLTFVIVIPFFVVVGLMIFPWYQSMVDMMKEAF
ncbi:hypothetical protein [Brevibacillus agri]|uniref:hypothetical protein n=1 Tax=Brevibacillus agri TaxID=51101 RepID=UPI0018CD86C1|nr:hypothetical protein [Brevibacillus agri]MBG9568468.1 hypothetical protein [Brevibacillus agri]